MPSGTATVTAKAGPAQQATATVISGITSFAVDIKRQVLQLWQGNEPSGPSREFDLTGVTTFTVTIASTNFTLTIS